MKYAHINENNQLLGWYDDTIHTTIPTPHIEVTDEQWSLSLAGNHNKVNADGTTEVFDFRSAEEIAQQDKDRQIKEATQYLNDTGWIWEKYNRNVVVLQNMTHEEFTTKYADIISAQEAYRELINTLELSML